MPPDRPAASRPHRQPPQGASPEGGGHSRIHVGRTYEQLIGKKDVFSFSIVTPGGEPPSITYYTEAQELTPVGKA